MVLSAKHMNIDILSIHANILQHFSDTDTAETKKKYVDELKKHLNEETLSRSTFHRLEHEITTLEDEVHLTQSNTLLNYYLLSTLPLIDEYTTLSHRKVHYFFHTRKTNDDADVVQAKKKDIIQKYLECIHRLFASYHFYTGLLPTTVMNDDDHDITSTLIRSHDIPSSSSSTTLSPDDEIDTRTCQQCRTAISLDMLDNQNVCTECGAVIDQYINQVLSYKDIERVNMNAKYTYDRRTHFRDCLLQFQGKQNVTIADNVYTALLGKLIAHALVPDQHAQLPQDMVFEKVTKEHIILFLKDMKCVKHYEDHVLIFKHLTGKPVPDLSHLEEDLLHDFDQLVESYDKKFKYNNDRKNFINTQYVLFQLLRRHKYPCQKEDFNILKTIDRKYYHDEICSELFHDLGWNFQPLF